MSAHVKTSKKSFAKKTFKKKAIVHRTLSPYADAAVHKFRRMMPEIVVANSANGVMNIYSSEPLQTFFTLGATTADLAIPGTALVGAGATLLVSLDNVIQYTDFTNLFNEYQIDKVELKIHLDNAPDYNAGAANTLPDVYVRYDPNDATMPTNFNDVAQSANCKELNFTDGKTVTEVAIPMPTQPMWVGAVTTGYAFPAKTSNLWLDTTAPSPQIQHFAFKFWIRNWISHFLV